MTQRPVRYFLVFVFLAAFATGFAPAPVYKPPVAKTQQVDLLAQMQGTWIADLSNNLAPGGKMPNLVLKIKIENNSWYHSISLNGTERPPSRYEMTLDTTRQPARMTLKVATSDRITMRGIVKMENNRVVFCYVSAILAKGNEEPTNFTDTTTPSGVRINTMILKRLP